MRRLPLIAALAAALAASPAGAVDRAYDPATEVSCDRLLAAALDLTKEAYLHDGATPAQAETEALLMLPERFFFWPADYFLLYPYTGDAEFMRGVNTVKERIGLGPNETQAKLDFETGEAQFRAAHYDDAAKSFEAAADRWPDSSLAMDALYQLGGIYFFAEKCEVTGECSNN